MIEPILAYVNILRFPSAIPAGQFTARFMNAVAGAGIKTHLIVQSAARGFNGHGGDGQSVLRDEYGIEPSENLKIHVIKMPFWRPASDRIIFLNKAGLLLNRLRKEYGVNIVMSRDTRALPYLQKWGKSGLKTIHDSHNYYVKLDEREDLSGKRWLRYQKLENRYLPSLDGLITLLEAQADLYRNTVHGPKIEAIHPGLDKTRLPDPERFRFKTIIYLGSFQAKKGVHLLLEAFIKSKLPDWKLIFAGGRDKAEIGQLEDKVVSLGLKNSVEITGWLSDQEMRTNLDKSSIAVLPLDNSFYNRYLTAPSKLFDYLAHSIPVITSDLPSVRELADDSVYYVQPDNGKELSIAIKKISNSPELHRELAEKAHQKAKNLLWEKRGEKTREFLESLF
ncbi:MAG: glycosyltransferase family 4 protein [Candidatus Electryonea clarkiae]|nr:glycosyltransferase family 4 protein [Candidatus Electryonea clarkiae]MDP8287825.1 glycosyltransferase family 4 protein [Candidatus Electryonea clarkiae]